MAIGLTSIVPGITAPPNLGLKQSITDAVDRAVLRYGDDVLMIVRPGDVIKTASRPTGSQIAHDIYPNDSLLFQSDGGMTVGPVSGKYGGKDVFNFHNGGLIDLRIPPGTMNSENTFSIFGLMHIASGSLGAGLNGIISAFNGGTRQAAFYHQFAGGIDYFVVASDQSLGGGGNYILPGSGPTSNSTPFFFLFRVVAGIATLFIEQLTTANATAGVANVPPTSSGVTVRLGQFSANDGSTQLTGSIGRLAWVRGDALSNATKSAYAAKVMTEMRLWAGLS
jgi:hypothetical protein